MTFKCNFIINHTRVVHHSQIVLHEIQSANVLMWIDVCVCNLRCGFTLRIFCNRGQLDRI